MKPLCRCVLASEVDAALQVLASELGLAGAVRFAGHDPHGRPRATWEGRALPLSLARCGEVRAVTLARSGRVGVDLVDPACDLQTEGLMDLMAPSERQWLEVLPAGQRRRKLFQVWAGREALLKALGLGLALGPGAVELEPCGREGLAPCRIPGCTRSPEGWHLALEEGLGPAAGLIMALAWAD